MLLLNLIKAFSIESIQSKPFINQIGVFHTGLLQYERCIEFWTEKGRLHYLGPIDSNSFIHVFNNDECEIVDGNQAIKLVKEWIERVKKLQNFA